MNHATAVPATAPRRAPGPTGLPFIGIARDWQNDPMGRLRDAWRQWGDVVRIPMGFADMFMLAHPDHVKHVLQENHLNYRKGFDYGRMEPLVGHGLLTSNGDTWKRHRRLAQPAFHRERIAGFGALMVRRTREQLERWRALGDGAKLDVHAEMNRLTLEVVGEALFSSQLEEVTNVVGEAMKVALHMTNERMNSLVALPTWVPTPFNVRYRRHLQVLDDVVGRILRERRERPPSDDLLSMLMEARDSETEASALDDVALRDEVMTLVLAGHETTANALTFSFLLLTQHPEIREALERTVDAALGDRAPTADDLQALAFVRQVAEESMRLYPPAWVFGRQAINDDVIGGYHVPKGSLVMAPPFLVHRDPRFWQEPDRFDPSRFMPEAAASRHRFAYFPFGGGPRQCIGNGFAIMELVLVLASVARQVRLEVCEPERVELEPLITLRPRGGLRARLRWR